MERTSKYSYDLKSQIVLEYEAGSAGLEELGEKYNISHSTMRK